MPPPPPSRGLLLINLGTPDAPTTPAVRRYLREFLSDGRVMDLPPLGRWLLLNLVILPFRPARSAEAYRKIWTERGSPLLAHGLDLLREVRAALEPELLVELAMRYGRPSIAEALERLRARGVQELTVLPLYPLNAASTTSSSLDRVYELVRRTWEVLPLRVVPPFFTDEGYLDALVEVTGPAIEQGRCEHVLFSFHGVPERHVRRSDPTERHCMASGESCCARLSGENRGCYRAQAFHLAGVVARRLGLGPEKWTVSFQSRLGRTKWVGPYTDAVVPDLARRGVRRLAVVSPSFVADCLETLEEIGIRARESFLAAGGEELVLAPSLNVHPRWVQAVVEMTRRAQGLVTGPSALTPPNPRVKREV